MITKLTAENNEIYQARFELMNAAFAKKGLSLEIKSLEEYFANIQTILEFVTANPEYTARCLAMAADEPVFEIDANSRVITVPPVFKKNGIAVIGDHWAETVYFKIDKYFDYQSFYKLLNDDGNGRVVINWAFTPAGSKAVGDMQTTPAFGPADDLLPGYLVFGWPIQKNMTQAAGTLTFSVQFYHISNGEIDYSFNTIPASIQVGNSLTLKNPVLVDNNYLNELALRLRNSAYRVDEIEGPDMPAWILDLPAKENMPFEADGTQSTLYLPAQAGIAKGVSIQYTWTATREGEDTTAVVGVDDYRPTNDTEPVANKLYYKAVTGGYALLVGDEKDAAFAALGEEDAEPIFELFSVLAIDKAGRYSVQANARVDISDGTWDSLSDEDKAQVEALTKSISSNRDGADNNAGYCLVPTASEPEVTLSVSSNLDPASYEVIDPEQNEFIYISNESAPTITASVNGEDLGALAVVMLDNEGKIVDSETVFADLADEDIATGEYNFARYDGDIPVSNGLTAQGQYKVGIINRLNATYAKGESDNIVTSFIAPKVTNISVSAGSGVEDTNPVVLLENGVRPNGNIVNVIMDDYPQFIFTDNTDYTDYRRDGDNNPIQVQYDLLEVVVDRTNPQQPTVQLDAEGAPVIKVESDPGIQELSTVGFKPLDAGDYLIRATTIYHGTKNIGYTDIFSVTSRA